MALVNVLRFNEHSGAMVSDEEFINIRFRKRLYCDNLHRLTTPEMTKALGCVAVYGGAGYPSLHHEIVTKTKARLAEMFAAGSKKRSQPGPTFGEAAVPHGMSQKPFKLVRDIGQVALEETQKALRRRIDDRLKLYYGFDSADLTAGSFKENDQTYDIKQEKVKEAALKLATGKFKDRYWKLLYDSRASIFGYDEENGVTGYYLDPDKQALCFNYEGFEAIGAGKYAAGIVFGRLMNRKNVQMRKAGLDRVEGMVELLKAGMASIDHFHPAGGNLNIVFFDGKAKEVKDRYKEIFDDRARLANEIVRALDWEFISRKECERLIDDVVFKDKKLEAVEADLMKKVKDARHFELALRGYKFDEAKEMVALPAKKGGK